MDKENILDLFEYIDVTGQKTLEEEPFNNVDSLIISQLSYMKLDKHVPPEAEKSDGISLEDILNSDDVELLYRDERNHDINKYYFEKVASCKRFSKMKLRDFVEVVSIEYEVQFCAMTAIFENESELDSDKAIPKLTYVVYRGTDEHMVGWKEDFNMIYKFPVPAHKMALRYLANAAERIAGDFYVGGHSKGGNLAVYASAEVSPEVQDRIIKVFSHDGPGFKYNFLKQAGYERIKDRIVKQVPKSSIFGLMLFTPDKYDIILSKDKGVEQHNPYNWLTDGTDFVYADELDSAYELQQKVFNTWTAEITDEQAKLYGDTLFDLIYKAGIDNINDLYNMSAMFSAAGGFYEAYKELDPEIKEKFDEVMELYKNIQTELTKEKTKQDVESISEAVIESVENVIETAKESFEVAKSSSRMKETAKTKSKQLAKKKKKERVKKKTKEITKELTTGIDVAKEKVRARKKEQE